MKKVLFLMSLCLMLCLTSCELLILGAAGVAHQSKKSKAPVLEKPEVTVTLSASSPSTEAVIKWTSQKDVDYYVVSRTFVRDGVTESTILGDFFEYEYTSTSCTDDNLEPGTKYTYTVSAVAYEKEWTRDWGTVREVSLPVSVITEADPKASLSYPENLSADSSVMNEVHLSWRPVESAVKYEIYSKTRYYGDYYLAGTVTSAEFIDKREDNDAFAYYKVRAIGEDGKYSLFSPFLGAFSGGLTNYSLNSAYPLLNGERQEFTVDEASDLWFVVEPESGIIEILWGQAESVSILDAEGNVILPSHSFDDSSTVEIPGFEQGKTYYIMIHTYRKFSIRVE